MTVLVYVNRNRSLMSTHRDLRPRRDRRKRIEENDREGVIFDMKLWNKRGRPVGGLEGYTY